MISPEAQSQRSVPTDNPTLPRLAVNRGFIAEFVAADPPCFALGLVKVDGARCALVALRPERAILNG